MTGRAAGSPDSSVPRGAAEGASLSWAVEVATTSVLPVLILEIPSERIVAASRSAINRLSPNATRQVVGSTLGRVSYRIPGGDLERPVGYQANRLVHVDGQVAPFQLWIRSVDPGRQSGLAFAVIAELDGSGGEPAAPPTVEALVGSVDQRLLIDRISTDVASLLHERPDHVLGLSMLDLVAPADVGVVLAALAQATNHGTGATGRMRLQCADGSVVPVLMTVVPLLPAPSCAFAAVPGTGPATASRSRSLDEALRRLTGATGMVAASGTSSTASGGQFPGMSRLSARELEVVRRLLSGDRVPAIARGLYLSQSTVRNYLSSVFRKLDVGSQQELLDLLRVSDGPPVSG